MSPFREALKAAGHGEWVIEMISASGEVRLRKMNERALEVQLAIPASEDGIVLKAAASNGGLAQHALQRVLEQDRRPPRRTTTRVHLFIRRRLTGAP